MPKTPAMSRFAVDSPSHEVGMDDLFFSTTDGRGVMSDTNEVFERLSWYSREELRGAAHNIVRHPDMPGGVFRTMWDILQSGEPFVGYVRNMSKGGSSYDVLATVTPLPDGGYLSVRTRPTTDMFDTVAAVYYEMNDLEHWQRNTEGRNRRETAENGAARLQEEMEKLGVRDYAEFMYRLLPAEIAEREKHSAIDVSVLAARNDVARAAVDVYRALDEFMGAQDEMAVAVEKLRDASARLEEGTATTAQVAEEMDNLSIQGPVAVLLLGPLRVWSNMQGIVAEHIGELDTLLSRLQPLSEHARFYIALGRLHALMTSLFAADEGERSESIAMLGRALESGLQSMSRLVSEHQRVSRRVAQKSGSVVSLLQIPREMIDTWLQETRVEELADDTQGLVEKVRAAIDKSDASMAQLSELSATLDSQTALQFDHLRAAITQLSEAIAAQ